MRSQLLTPAVGGVRQRVIDDQRRSRATGRTARRADQRWQLKCQPDGTCWWPTRRGSGGWRDPPARAPGASPSAVCYQPPGSLRAQGADPRGPDFRDTREVPKSRVKIHQRRWKETLDPVLEQLKTDLGLPAATRLRAELHSMLVYAPGQFFLPHQDSEKHDTMVGVSRGRPALGFQRWSPRDRPRRRGSPFRKRPPGPPILRDHASLARRTAWGSLTRRPARRQ